MSTCHTCGNDYPETFTLIRDGESYEFDSFECAISALAPECEECGCRILGHGVQHGETIFCCAHCARRSGVTELRDSA